MTIEDKTIRRYTPITFFENAKRHGLREAWKIDKSMTAQRNPNLARVHGCGVEAVRYSKRFQDRLLDNAETPLEKTVWLLSYGPSLAIGSALGYPMAVVGGLLGAKPEDFRNNLSNSGETQ
jgi:hypothetical protein